jgi:hypothetical protein
VALTVADAGDNPVLELGATSVEFVAVRGAPSPSPVVVALSNSGGGSFSALGTVDAGAVSYGGSSPAGFSSPQVAGSSLTLAPSTGSLAVGGTRHGPGGQPAGRQRLGLVTVSGAASADCTSLAPRSRRPRAVAPPSQSLTLSSTGGGTFMTWGATSPSGR